MMNVLEIIGAIILIYVVAKLVFSAYFIVKYQFENYLKRKDKK